MAPRTQRGGTGDEAFRQRRVLPRSAGCDRGCGAVPGECQRSTAVNLKQPVAREDLVRFLFQVETNPRVRLVASQWTLRDPSESDKWTAEMTFLRRDPDMATTQ